MKEAPLRLVKYSGLCIDHLDAVLMQKQLLICSWDPFLTHYIANVASTLVQPKAIIMTARYHILLAAPSAPRQELHIFATLNGCLHAHCLDAKAAAFFK